MHVLEVATKVATLGEELPADVALIRSLHRVLPEMVAKIAALAEDRLAALILASEVQFSTFGLPVVDLDRLMPLFGDALELLGKGRLTVHLCRALAWDSTILLLFRALSLVNGLATFRAWRFVNYHTLHWLSCLVTRFS